MVTLLVLQQSAATETGVHDSTRADHVVLLPVKNAARPLIVGASQILDLATEKAAGVTDRGTGVAE